MHFFIHLAFSFFLFFSNRYTVANATAQGPAGPFGYGQYADDGTGAAFYFGSILGPDNLQGGMCTQNYFNWTVGTPSPDTWTTPPECLTADYCPDWLWNSKDTSEHANEEIPYGVTYHCPYCQYPAPAEKKRDEL